MRPATRAASGSRALVLTRGGSVPKHRGGRTVTRSSVLLAAAAIRRAHAAAAFGRRASPSRLAAAGKGDGDAPGGQVDEVEETMMSDLLFEITRLDMRVPLTRRMRPVPPPHSPPQIPIPFQRKRKCAKCLE